MIRVDQDVDPVAGRIEIAPREVGDDLVGLGVVGENPHEQCGRVVGDAELGTLARRAGVVRLALDEPVRGLHGLPELVAQLAAAAHGFRRRGHRHGIDARGRGGAGRSREREREDCGNHGGWRT